MQGKERGDEFSVFGSSVFGFRIARNIRNVFWGKASKNLENAGKLCYTAIKRSKKGNRAFFQDFFEKHCTFFDFDRIKG